MKARCLYHLALRSKPQAWVFASRVCFQAFRHQRTSFGKGEIASRFAQLEFHMKCFYHLIIDIIVFGNFERSSSNIFLRFRVSSFFHGRHLFQPRCFATLVATGTESGLKHQGYLSITTQLQECLRCFTLCWMIGTPKDMMMVFMVDSCLNSFNLSTPGEL